MHNTLNFIKFPKENSGSELKTLSIIIPIYNEERTITQVLDKIRAVLLIYDIDKEIIIINDCSKDVTEQVIQEYLNNHNV